MAKAKVPAAYYVREWYEKSEIDYFSAFVKAYIPFNAWMNDHFKGEATDRAMLERVKSDANTFRQKILTLLELEDTAGYEFRGAIGSLHGALEESTVANSGEKISFQNVVICKNSITNVNQSYHGLQYSAKYDQSTGATTVEVKENKSGKILVALSEPGYPTEDTVIKNPSVNALNQSRLDYLLGVYRQVNPRKEESLLYQGRKKKEGIVCGAYKMIKEEKKLAAGLIEILYSLRNALFHGVIDPNKDANKVYGAAYRIMHTLVGALT
ncbi:MAG: hypothetical protein MJ109_00240 [Kiritimatiellae bacterium]|nr:hypothetical protein [Kiritimatiellia bacterium]